MAILRSSAWKAMLVILVVFSAVYAALVVPTDIELPGTQPGEATNVESVDKCDNCHGGYDQDVEPGHNWRGSMMAQAGRDPIFWATMAVAEQAFAGSGDLCLRCHSPTGWLDGRSTPTDGSALLAGDSDGLECDMCHSMTNPDNSEFAGVMNAPYAANDGGSPATGYYGSGMYSLTSAFGKLGPYADDEAKHKSAQSAFHRSVNFCGTCHDVSNSAVGDLAHNNGSQVPLTAGTFSGVPGAPVDTKAAFNNFPFQYGVVERTFSEHMSSLWPTTPVSDYNSLPDELRDGALEAVYDAAIVAGTGGDYADGTTRFFSCQSCHMAPVVGQGCNKNPPVRTDLPLHDMTGGNYWMPDAIAYLDTQSKLRLGGGMNDVQLDGLLAGKARALHQLSLAVSVSIEGNTVKVVNHTGHKVISGYPEGRRMWLNVKWYDQGGALVREDGEYGSMIVSIDGQDTVVETLLDLHDSNTKVYQAHYAMTQEWANQLLSLGYPASMVLGYDRLTGAVDYTLGDLGAQAAGTYHETFHFVLNNYVAKDNRIPPYGMSYDTALARSALPVPADQYGDPGPGGTYRHWDEITLDPPAGAVNATVSMMYQPTSWEYVQFLYLTVDDTSEFLANEGIYLLEAWQATGMATPHVMAAETWELEAGPTVVGDPVLNSGVDQRSEIRSVAVMFSEDVSVTPDALQLYRHDGAVWVAVPIAAPLVYSGSTATWDLAGAVSADGHYAGVLASGRIANGDGHHLDGDGDGSAGGDYVFAFHRLAGDINGDRQLAAADIDQLNTLVYGGGSGSDYDLTGDAVTDAADVDMLVITLFGSQYGDANLNGDVDLDDFTALKSTFASAGSWSSGDFDGSGGVDLDDFTRLKANFGYTNPGYIPLGGLSDPPAWP